MLIARRVGLDPDSRLRWLLGFINTEGAGDASMTNAELKMLAERADWHTRLHPAGDKTAELDQERLRVLARELKQGVEKLLSGKHFEIYTHGWARHSAVVSSGELLISHLAEHLSDLFKSQGFGLITAKFNEIKACKRCANFFQQARAGQEFCSPRCAQAVRNARYLAKLGGKSKS